MSDLDREWGITLNKRKAIVLLHREVASFVYEAVNLEGINFTFSEIQTLLEGITVGGHKISDQTIATNQGDTWKHLIDTLKNDTFALDAQYACALHGIAAKEEALTWGAFRSGGVTIAGSTWLPPRFDELPSLFDKMASQANQIDDVYDRAIYVFLEMARNQFFYDVNKRMGRFMMNGILVDNGFPAINLPANKQTEFNKLMMAFYETNDKKPMNQFMRSCLDPRIIEIMKEPVEPEGAPASPVKKTGSTSK